MLLDWLQQWDSPAIEFGEVLSQHGRHAEGLAFFDLALREEAGDPHCERRSYCRARAHIARGTTLMGLGGRKEEAIAAFEAAFELAQRQKLWAFAALALREMHRLGSLAPESESEVVRRVRAMVAEMKDGVNGELAAFVGEALSSLVGL